MVGICPVRIVGQRIKMELHSVVRPIILCLPGIPGLLFLPHPRVDHHRDCDLVELISGEREKEFTERDQRTGIGRE